MAKRIEQSVEYYYDSHPTREDLMGETPAHASLVHYLIDVLRWQLRDQVCAVYENFNFYQTLEPNEYPLAPDIAVIKGVEFQEYIRSWKVWQAGIVPQVVFEIASEETWKNDLEKKPVRYAQMGVQEYFAYDPNHPPVRKRARHRLFGWQFEPQSRQMREMVSGIDGRLWSVELESWLVPDGGYLRLYDRHGRLRLTQAQAEEQRANAEAQRADAIAEHAKAEAQRADAQAQRAKLLAEKLRALGIDPDQV